MYVGKSENIQCVFLINALEVENVQDIIFPT
jgi:hypothetical protein